MCGDKPLLLARKGLAGQLAVAFSLIDSYSEGFGRAFHYRDYWSYCLLMALLSRDLVHVGGYRTSNVQLRE